MTNLKIEDRKNTTAKALKKLEALVNSFEFENDIKTVVSPGSILCVGDIGGDRDYVWSDSAEWKIENGVLTLNGWVELYGYESESEIRIDSIKKIDFGAAIKSLENVIVRYNDVCREKDAQIEKFLALCAAA